MPARSRLALLALQCYLGHMEGPRGHQQRLLTIAISLRDLLQQPLTYSNNAYAHLPRHADLPLKRECLTDGPSAEQTSDARVRLESTARCRRIPGARLVKRPRLLPHVPASSFPGRGCTLFQVWSLLLRTCCTVVVRCVTARSECDQSPLFVARCASVLHIEAFLLLLPLSRNCD